jgi:Glycosyltransferase WbsX
MDGSQSSSTRNLQAEQIGVSHQYWGAFTGFNRKRSGTDAVPVFRTVLEFQQSLDMSFRAMAHPSFDTGINLFFITAWNQWNEQAVLEPDERDKFGYLNSIQHSLQRIPVPSQITRPLFIYHAGPALSGAAGIQCAAQKHLDTLAEEGIHYLGGQNNAPQCGRPLKFDVRAVSQCSGGTPDCKARLRSFDAHLEGLRSQKATAMISEVGVADPLKTILSTVRRGWHVRVLLSYRRYHEWLPDIYKQLFPMENFKQWPNSVGDDDLIVPSFPDFYRRMHPTAADQIQGAKPHSDLLDFFENFRKEYDDIRIFNLHDGFAGSKVSSGDFFCQMLPEFPNTCESFSTDTGSGSPIDLTVSEARSPFLHDRLAVGAFFRGWVDKSLDREYVRNAVKKRLADSGHIYPLECLSSAEAKAFLQHSVTTEKTVVPTFYASNMGEPDLLSQFFSSLHNNKFCSEDVKRILNDRNWKPFFRSLHTSRDVAQVTNGSQNSPSGLHVVISYCKEPVEWIWKRLLADVQWKSMTIFSKCGKSIMLPKNAHVVRLPNVGSHHHSYAYWIADILEPQDKTGFGKSATTNRILPHDYVKFNPNDSVMFVNDGEFPSEGSTFQSEGSTETRLPWKDLMAGLENKGFACATRVDFDGAQALNVVSKKNVGLFRTIDDPSAPRGFKSAYRNLEDWVGSLPIDLTLGSQALNARAIKMTTAEIGGAASSVASTSVHEYMPAEENDLFMPVCYGGYFVASVERILESPVGNWGAIEKSLGRGEKIEETQFMERIWAALLSPPLSRKEQEDLMKKDFEIIRRRGNKYKGLVTIPKPKP